MVYFLWLFCDFLEFASVKSSKSFHITLRYFIASKKCMELKSGKFQKNNGSFVSFVIGFGLKIVLCLLCRSGMPWFTLRLYIQVSLWTVKSVLLQFKRASHISTHLEQHIFFCTLCKGWWKHSDNRPWSHSCSWRLVGYKTSLGRVLV